MPEIHYIYTHFFFFTVLGSYDDVTPSQFFNVVVYLELAVYEISIDGCTAIACRFHVSGLYPGSNQSQFYV